MDGSLNHPFRSGMGLDGLRGVGSELAQVATLDGQPSDGSLPVVPLDSHQTAVPPSVVTMKGQSRLPCKPEAAVVAYVQLLKSCQ